MRFFHSKYYDNNAIALLSALLYQLKWIALLIMVANSLSVLDKATSSYGLEDETAFWYTFGLVVTVALFVFKTKWQKIADRITDFLNERI